MPLPGQMVSSARVVLVHVECSHVSHVEPCAAEVSLLEGCTIVYRLGSESDLFFFVVGSSDEVRPAAWSDRTVSGSSHSRPPCRMSSS